MGNFITNPRIDALLKQGCVDEALHEPIRACAPTWNGVAGFVRAHASASSYAAEDVSYAAVTLGHFLYEYARIDPEVLRGVEFARASDVDGVLSFAHFADTKANLTGAHLDGLHSQLQGYVAEQVVAHHLTAQGHDVFFPHAANNPGWDLMVDGHPFQVKCLTEAGGVLEHLHRYPEIPVIVNADLAEQVGNHASVYVDAELHHDAIRHATEETLERGRELADFEIPWISLSVSGAFNLLYMIQNATDLKSMVTCTATDTIGRTVGGFTGKSAGTALGLFIFGPAGAIVVGMVGAVGGAATGRRAIAKARRILVASEEAAVRGAAHRVAEAAAVTMPSKIEAWNRKSELIAGCISDATPNAEKVRSFILDHIGEQINYWRRKESELEMLNSEDAEDPRTLIERVLLLARRAGVHPHHVQGALSELQSTLKEYLDGSRRFRTAATD